jgi:hypothetical protein
LHRFNAPRSGASAALRSTSYVTHPRRVLMAFGSNTQNLGNLGSNVATLIDAEFAQG